MEEKGKSSPQGHSASGSDSVRHTQPIILIKGELQVPHVARSTQKRDAIIIAFPMAHTVKNLPLMQETRVRSVGQEDPLVKGMATHSSILAWRIPQTEEPGRLQSMGSQEVGHD